MGDINLEDLKITEKCTTDMMELLPCPWKPAPADCWKAKATKVTAVMRRKLVDHHELEYGVVYNFKGGFSVMELVANGAITKGEYEEDEPLEIQLELAMIGFVYGACILAAITAFVF